MKSYEVLTIGLYEALLSDAATEYPSIRSSFEKDLSCLKLALEQRGLPFFTITLPALGKAFDKWLSLGSISKSHPIPQGVKARHGRPELFRGLLDMVFNKDGVFLPDPDVGAIALLRQLYVAVKRLKLPCHEDYIHEAISDFYDVEENQPRPHSGTWDSDIPVWSDCHGHPIWGVQDRSGPDLFGESGPVGSSFPWDEFRALCRKFTSELGEFDWFGLKPKHGPGVVSDPGDGIKYDFAIWPQKLERCFPWDWYGTHAFGVDKSYPSSYEPSSKLICVPKTQKGPRLIASEPTSHQWIQGGIQRWFEGRLGRTFLRESITFRSQETSQKRALLGSQTGSLSTVDLSSASDRLSARLVHYVFQGHKDLLDAMHAVRTRSLRQDISPLFPEVIMLRKFSTMGSALTFPVQTIVFSLLSTWAVMLSEGQRDLRFRKAAASRVTVYGDDIIVPTTAVGVLKLLLQECGLKVNESKTFSEGYFRESCGCDAYNGVDVTPAYALQPYQESVPESLASVVEASNNFLRKGLWRTADYLKETLPVQVRKKLNVVSVDSGQFGLISFAPEGGFRTEFWNSDLHKWEQIVLGISSKVSKVRGSADASLLQYFMEEPSPFVDWEAGQPMRPKIRKSLRRV